MLSGCNTSLESSFINTLPPAVKDLPVMALASDVIAALSDHDVLLRAEPGAGKSTGLPLALLAKATVNNRIVLLEPRRLAARLVAQRLAHHLGEPVGKRIGLRMRSDTRVSKETLLTVVTEGVLTRMLQADPGLEGIGLVIFDEFHERSLQADLGLTLCLEVQQALRRDIRLLLMSATLDMSPLISELADVKHFDCSVRQHPVHIHWSGESSAALEPRACAVVLDAIGKHSGDILVFLPGVAEIRRTAKLVTPHLDGTIELHSLHSGASAEEQLKATTAATAGTRRLILATSLAETSITIDGVRVVVDSGLERRSTTDVSTGAQRLETVTASQASATQRTGRAGRTSEGHCYRLWSKSGHTRRSAQWQPEIHRADLAPLVIELGLWGAASTSELAWLDSPPAASIARAQELLTRLGLWENGQLNLRGKQVAALPVHPRLGRMLLWGKEHGVGQLACRIAAVLDEPNRSTGSADLESALNGRLSHSQQQRLTRLSRLLKPASPVSASPSPHTRTVNSADPAAAIISAAVVLAQAFPDWIAQRRPGEPGSYRLACGTGVRVAPDDALAHSPWLVAAELGGAGQQLRVFKALELDIKELEEHAPECFTYVKHVDWDDKHQRVVAERRHMLSKLVINAHPVDDISREERSRGLIAGIRKLGLDCLPWTDECREWQARVQQMPLLTLPGNDIEWPAVDDQSLLTSLEDWLSPWLDGLGSIKALRQVKLHKILTSKLDYQQQQLLDEWLPQRYQVPSGSRLALSYVKPGNPVLSVRLQEMLGCTENPTVAKGQVPLKLELLSPAQRPVQVTTDLKGFWSNSYPEVRKEMAGRYPKHHWPADPVNAVATVRSHKGTLKGGH